MKEKTLVHLILGVMPINLKIDNNIFNETWFSSQILEDQEANHDF